jgi:hypothetical protein
MTVRFADIAPATPTRESLAARYAALNTALDAGERQSALSGWDALRREYDTWSALVHLRFEQDTTDPAARDARDYADSLAPEATEMEVAMKRRLLADPDRAAVERLAGKHALRLWETDITTFDPAIKADLEAESKLVARYTELLASARIEIDRQTVNLSGLGPFAESPDRTAPRKPVGRSSPRMARNWTPSTTLS